MFNNYQREGSIAGSQVGREFETAAQTYFRKRDLQLEKGHSILLGVGAIKKKHKFDLGSGSPPVLVECKSHKWNPGGKVPTGKMQIWNEAMYYFHLTPPEYRKIMFVLRDYSDKKKETLAQYYIRIHGHMIPDDVEIVEFNAADGAALWLRPVQNKVRPEVMVHFQASTERNRRLGKLLAQ